MTAAKIRNSLLLLLLVSIVLPVATGCSTNPVTGRRELIAIPRAYEISMGLQAAPQVEKQFGGPVADATLQAYVQMVGKKVAAVADRKMPYDFTLVNSEIPNAFALPGGKIFVTAGLMTRMTNEQQLAAVLGHEIVHVAALHGVKGMQRGIGASVVVELAAAAAGEDKAEAAKAASQIAASMITMKYGRDDEYESDKYGMKYMTKAGYNPWGMPELLTILLNLSKKEPGALEEMFQTHPLSSKRIAAVKANIADDAMYRGYSPATPDPKTAQFLGMHKRLMKSATFKSGPQPGQ
ncbi:MAG: M48 family metallopeptidase [Phycisphaerae bacterium]|jgi:predicted Zn-dependent protease|nr:M48 family metallopeptidase [Phycisphaerae bacterium]